MFFRRKHNYVFSRAKTRCTPAGTAARALLEAWREYLRALVANLRSYAITEVSDAGEKTSILLKDTWVDSFSKADRSFMRAFGETQMFDWFADVALQA